MAAHASANLSLPSPLPPLTRGSDFQVIRRDGSLSPFDPAKISVAITKAFVAVEGASVAASHRSRDVVESLTAQIVARFCAAHLRRERSTSKTSRTRWSSL